MEENLENPIIFYEIPDEIKLEGEKFVPITMCGNKHFKSLYYISNFGRVYSSYRGGRILSPGKDHKGYLSVYLSGDEKFKSIKVHRLVLNAFQPNFNMNEMQINHKDGNKENNNLDNLEWCNQSQNITHAYRTGLMDMSMNRILSDDDVKNIRELRNSGLAMGEIWKNGYSDKISYDSICDICNNITYYDPEYFGHKSIPVRYTEFDIKFIRETYNNGSKPRDIWRNYYNNRDYSTILDVCKNKSYYDPNYIPRNN